MALFSRRQLISTAIAVVATVPLAGQTASGVISARLQIVSEPGKALVAIITNRHDKPLVSWAFRVGGTTFYDVAEGGPIRASESYRIERTNETLPADLADARPVFATFDDGSMIGEGEYLAQALADREAAVQRAAYLIGVIQTMPLSSDAEAVMFIRKQRDARWRAGEAVSLEPLLAEMQRRTREGQARAVALAQLTGYRANLKRVIAERDGLLTAVTATDKTPIPISLVLEVFDRPRLAAFIENRSQTPIVAWSLSEYLSPETRSSLTRSTHYPCPDPSGTRPGTGYLQPAERRRLSMIVREPDARGFPRIELSMIVFADRRAEGDPTQRDEALAQLEVQRCR